MALPMIPIGDLMSGPSKPPDPDPAPLPDEPVDTPLELEPLSGPTEASEDESSEEEPDWLPG